MNLQSALARLNSLLIFLMAGAVGTDAATITWTNTTSGNWSVESNWSPNAAPATNDIAVITNAGNYTVTVNLNTTIAGLTVGGGLGAQTVRVLNRTLTLNGSGTIGSNDTLLLAGTSALEGMGRIQIQGNFRWEGGALGTNMAVMVAPAGRMTIASGAAYAKILNGSLTNAGSVIWQPVGNLVINGRLHNLSGGWFDAQISATIGGSGLIINDGVFRATPGSLSCDVPLINSGSVETLAGRLTLASGSVFNTGSTFTGAGQTWINSGTNTINGSIHSENLFLLYNATLAGTSSFSGTVTWGGGNIGPEAAITVQTNGQLKIESTATFAKILEGSLTNRGTITWKPPGSLVLAGPLHNFGVFDAQQGGTILQGRAGLIVNDGLFRSSSGPVNCEVPVVNNGMVESLAGVLALASGSVFNAGSAFTGAGQTWINSGTNTISGSIHSENLFLLYSATLVGTGSFSGTLTWGGGNIGPEAAITVQTNGQLKIESTATFAKVLAGSLTNAGTMTWKPSGGLFLAGPLHNFGVFDVPQGGTIYPGNGGLIINDGLLDVATTPVSCEVPFANRGIARVSSTSLTFQNSFSNPVGRIELRGGTFRTASPLHLEGGQLTGWGNVWADVTNAACIRPSATNGVLKITGRYRQMLDGRLEFELGGNSPGTNQSRLEISGAAVLRGAVGVHWTPGFLVTPGAKFQVLTFASRQGEFCSFDNCYLLGQGCRVVPLYSAQVFELGAIAAPEPTAVPLNIGVDRNSVLVSWPVEFPGFALYWNTNLNQTNWTVISAVTNRWLEFPPLAPQKFFRLFPQ